MADFLEIGAAGALLGLLGWAVVDGLDYAPHPTIGLRGGDKSPSAPAQALAIAQKWGPMFGCPVNTMMIIGAIESGYRPAAGNFSPQGMTRGGAFGMWQQTLYTAHDNAAALARSPDPDVQATLRKWTGKGPDLFDPDLCGMFAAYQLGKLTAEFGDDIKLVAGGYHQGAGKIRQMLAQGRPIPDELPPHGKTYVTRALAAAAAIG